MHTFPSSSVHCCGFLLATIFVVEIKLLCPGLTSDLDKACMTSSRNVLLFNKKCVYFFKSVFLQYQSTHKPLKSHGRDA